MLTLLLSLFSVAALQDPTRPGDGRAELDAWVDRFAGGGCAGHLLVARGERVLYERGFGLADREQGRPWSRTTLAPVGSITKQFTAAAVMKLVEEGKLAVDDTLAEHFEGVPADKAGITLEQLLTHTSGLFDLSREIPDPQWIDRDDMIATVLDRPLVYPPGTRYQYSNTGFSFLAAIVEQRSGQGCDAFLREKLLRPAGMSDTGYLREGFERARLSVGYAGEQRRGTLPDDVYTPDGPSWVLLGNGGILSSAEDMQRWALALLEARVLSKASIERMWSPLVDESNGFRESFYGYGWAIFELGGHRLITHNGGDGINFAVLGIVPDQRLIAYLATNTKRDCPELEEPLTDFLRRILAVELSLER